MKNDTFFDVLVVYTDGIALSAANRSSKSQTPFDMASSRANYNDAYAYFLEMCRQNGLTAAFSTSADIIGPGACSSYWTYGHKRWNKVRHACYSPQIFDKFSPLDDKKKLERSLLFSSREVRPFNSDYLAMLFFDKLKTYEELEEFAIPTVSISDRSKAGISKAIRRLRDITARQLSENDFTQAIIVKDRFGAGGNNIFKVTENYSDEIFELLNTHADTVFVIQPFLLFDKGYQFRDMSAPTDIRLIYQNGQIIQTYIRIAKASDFRCNEHQGGMLVYVSEQDIPKKLIRMAERISAVLGQDNSLFALDFIVSNSGKVYFLEGNIGPGLDWNVTKKVNEKMSKRLIRSIVEELSCRTGRLMDEISDFPVIGVPLLALPDIYEAD